MILKQLKLFIVWIVVSPWVMAFLSTEVLPSGPAYDFARILSLISWFILVFVGVLYFIKHFSELMKELLKDKED